MSQEAKPWDPRWWLPALLVTLVVVAGGALAMWFLGVWAPIPQRVSDPEKLRLDRIKTGLTVAAGLAAGLTLLLTLRRQLLSERAQQFAESDALEQRTTTLYVAAAEQLGSDKAAVRLAGLYALERLGQDNPKLRQTVFDVWCAYLRMPYMPPVDVLRRNADDSPEHWPAEEEPANQEADAERRQELEVRLTAQRLLGAHLSVGLAKAGMSTYWYTASGNRLVVNLVGAVLIDFNLSACAAGRVNASEAQFHGVTDLNGAEFCGVVELGRARFYGTAHMRETHFYDDVVLSKARFYGDVHARTAHVHGDIYMGAAQFHGRAYLHALQSHGEADLAGVQFSKEVDLGGGEFHGYVDFGRTQFHGKVNLNKTVFHGEADLSEAEFHQHASLRGTQFRDDVSSENVRFHSYADLKNAQFHGFVELREEHFHRGVGLKGAQVSSATRLPSKWNLLATASDDGLRTVLSSDDAVITSVGTDGAS